MITNQTKTTNFARETARDGRRLAAKLNRICKLVARHDRALVKGKLQYIKAEGFLEKILALNPPIEAPIHLPGGTVIMIVDNWAGKNTAFTSASFRRFSIKPYRAARPVKDGNDVKNEKDGGAA